MAYPGYLRYYDGAVRELADRGHEVELCFNIDTKQAEGYDALPQLGAANERITTGTLPKIRRELWKPITTGHATRHGLSALFRTPASETPLSARARGDRLPERLGFLRDWEVLEPRWAGRIPSLARLLEAAIPTNPEHDEFIVERRPMSWW